MGKIVRKLASVLSPQEDRDNRFGRKPLFVGVVETDRINLENIGRFWRLR